MHKSFPLILTVLLLSAQVLAQSNADALAAKVLNWVKDPSASSAQIETGIKQVAGLGTQDGCFLYSEFDAIYNKLRDAYPAFVTEKRNMGQSYEKRNLWYFVLGSSAELDESTKNLVLFTSLHHARECISLTMTLSLFITQLKTLVHKRDSEGFFKNNAIVFHPFVNIDGYLAINKAYGTSSYQTDRMIRKNRRNGSEFDTCSNDRKGVDINRNYDFKFGEDNQGSSPNECAEDYRGKSAFSEPESVAVKNFVESHPNLVSAMNFHSYGDLWIHPFNYLNDASNHPLEQSYHRLYDAYMEFSRSGVFPSGAKFGNAIKTIQYLANGEASDWMLATKRIFAFSPELSVNDRAT